MGREPSRRLVGIVFAALLLPASIATAQAPPLGTAANFAVLAGTGVNNTGASIVNGDLGVSPGSAVTGFPPGVVVGGTIHAADATAAGAQNDASAAYNMLASRPCTADLTGQNLGGLVLTPGVYCFSTAAQLTGTLTLNGLGNANAVFVFRIGSTLTTSSDAAVLTSGGTRVCKVFWQVGSSATLGTGTVFVGNILADSSITLTTGAATRGRLLALNGAVTLDSNSVSVPGACADTPVCPTINVAPSALPGGTVGVAYAQTLTGSGGSLPYTFSLTTGTLPAGLVLTAAGGLTGTPTTAGSSTVTVRITDANGCIADVVFTIVIAAAPPPPPVCPTIALNPATLPGGRVDVAYLQAITGSGGRAPYSFGVITGTLPPGLVLNATGVVSGTPTAAGTSPVTIRATDADGCTGSVSYAIVIAPAAIPPPTCPSIELSPATLASGTVGMAYSQLVTGSGGVGPYTFGAPVGTLPAGLTLAATGGISGTPAVAGSSSFTIRGTDALGCFGERPYVTTIAAGPAVPALTVWAATALALVLVLAGLWRIRRQRT